MYTKNLKILYGASIEHDKYKHFHVSETYAVSVTYQCIVNTPLFTVIRVYRMNIFRNLG
jgi:hypothetical protein